MTSQPDQPAAPIGGACSVLRRNPNLSPCAGHSTGRRFHGLDMTRPIRLFAAQLQRNRYRGPRNAMPQLHRLANGAPEGSGISLLGESQGYLSGLAKLSFNDSPVVVDDDCGLFAYNGKDSAAVIMITQTGPPCRSLVGAAEALLVGGLPVHVFGCVSAVELESRRSMHASWCRASIPGCGGPMPRVLSIPGPIVKREMAATLCKHLASLGSAK